MDDALIFWRYIASSIDRLVAIVEEVGAADLDWRPPAAGANSLGAIVTHVLGNCEENLLGVLAGIPVGRDREAELSRTGVAPGEVRARWGRLAAQANEILDRVGDAELRRETEHPRRGRIRGLEVLIVVARHAAEHLAQAELTRVLLHAARGDAEPADGGRERH